MNRIAKFEKISPGNFYHSIKEERGISQEDAESIYAALQLPQRATTGSAGYDFHTPFAIDLLPGETAKIPTGIRCKMEADWVLMLFPRSGLGFKYRLQLNNTVGVIDSDYYNSDNEGHIFIKITNDSNEGKEIHLVPGDSFAQGVFLPYGITEDDCVSDVRNGGFGSTDKK